MEKYFRKIFQKKRCFWCKIILLILFILNQTSFTTIFLFSACIYSLSLKKLYFLLFLLNQFIHFIYLLFWIYSDPVIKTSSIGSLHFWLIYILHFKNVITLMNSLILLLLFVFIKLIT